MVRNTAAAPPPSLLSNYTHLAAEVVRQKPWTVALLAVGMVLITYQFTAGRHSTAPQVSVTPGDHASRVASAPKAEKATKPLRDGSAAEALAAGELTEVTPEEVTAPPAPARVAVLDIVGKLAVAALGIYALAAVTKRLKGGPVLGPASSGAALRVVETVTLGPNRALHIVEAEGRNLLIATDSGQVSLLTELSPGPAAAPRPSRTAAAPRRLQAEDFVDLGTPEPERARPARRRVMSPAAALDDEVGAAALLAPTGDDPASLARKREMLVKALQQRAG